MKLEHLEHGLCFFLLCLWCRVFEKVFLGVYLLAPRSQTEHGNRAVAGGGRDGLDGRMEEGDSDLRRMLKLEGDCRVAARLVRCWHLDAGGNGCRRFVTARLLFCSTHMVMSANGRYIRRASLRCPWSWLRMNILCTPTPTGMVCLVRGLLLCVVRALSAGGACVDQTLGGRWSFR